MGSGIGSLDDVYETTVAFEKGVRLPWVQKAMLLTNSRATERCPLSLSLVS
jgi:hypothetical protein